MIHAARRDFGLEADLEATYNEETDEIELFQFRTVIPNGSQPSSDAEIVLSEAQKYDKQTEVGDALGVKVDTSKFGRIAAQSAKQIIIQKVRDAEKAQVYDEFKERVGELLNGHVRRMERNGLIIDLGD